MTAAGRQLEESLPQVCPVGSKDTSRRVRGPEKAVLLAIGTETLAQKNRFFKRNAIMCRILPTGFSHELMYQLFAGVYSA